MLKYPTKVSCCHKSPPVSLYHLKINEKIYSLYAVLMWSNVDNASWQILKKKVLSVNVVVCSLTSSGACFRHVNVISRNQWYPLSILLAVSVITF